MQILNQELLNAQGFAFGSIPDSFKNVIDIALQIGRVYKPETMPLVQTLTPRSVETESANTYSGNYGTGDFPFHTDMAHWHIPPRYILLACIIPDDRVKTKLAHWSDIQREIAPDCIRRARFMPRRRLNNQMYHLRIQHGMINRWDPLFIKPANCHGSIFKNLMSDIDLDGKCNVLNFSKPGDLLLLDNWQVLHSRSSVPIKSKRMLKRIYISELN